MPRLSLVCLQEFVDVSPAQRNWKGIAISLLVIVVVCSLITMSVVVLTPAEQPSSGRSRLTVADLYKPEFSVHDPEAKWISNSEVVYRNRDGHVIKFNFASNETEVILTNSTFVAFKVVKYSLSADLKFALFAYDVKQMYRYSYTASYIVYNIYTREVWELNPPEVHDAVLQHAAWGTQGQQLIYIFENNIYYQADVKSNSLRITSSGMEGVIFNGLTDWLYEEEILRSHLAHWWSPDGERLAFLTINDSLVPSMVLPQFTGNTYPRGLQYPYPVAGQKNPTVKLSVVNLFGATHTQELQPPDLLRDFYVTMVTWISNTHLAVRWVNRPQNASLLTECDATIGACKPRHGDSSETWLSMQEPLFSRDRSRFFLSLPVKQGGQGDFHHVTMFSRKVSPPRPVEDEVRHLTSGDWEVTELLAYDENNQIIYFLSTEDAAEQRHVYSVSTLGLFPRRCLTCGLKEGCLFFAADINPDAQHAVLHCKGQRGEGRNDAKQDVEVSALSRIQTEIRTISNDDFGIRRPQCACISVPLGPISHNLLLRSIGSPGGQAVTEEFGLDWASVLAGSDQVVVARLDGRGSGSRGQRYRTSARALGLVPRSVRDYGGFLALTMLKSTVELIGCAAAQAPVTDWSMYGDRLANGALIICRFPNVHFQHSAELIKHLIRIGANYTMQIYPDEGHFLSTRSHIQLTQSLINYFSGCLLDSASSLDRQQHEDDA
uniref:Dipeptidyl peptidase like 10 n=1 Tax=Gasterosteus aculeatus aculeatus TaxID=481459 RepID=G3PQ81_GASAC